MGALILEGDERTTEFDGLRQEILDKVIGETEHVSGGQIRLSVGAEGDVGGRQEAVAAQDFAGIGVPHHELVVRFSQVSNSSRSIAFPVPPPAARKAISRKRPISRITFGALWWVMI